MSWLEAMYSAQRRAVDFRAWLSQATFHNPRVRLVSADRSLAAFLGGYDALDFAETC